MLLEMAQSGEGNSSFLEFHSDIYFDFVMELGLGSVLAMVLVREAPSW